MHGPVGLRVPAPVESVLVTDTVPAPRNRTSNYTGGPIVTSVNLNTIPEHKNQPIRAKRVTVQTHRVHREMWNNLDAITNDRILKFRPHPPGWCVYLNPAFTVEAPEFSPEFNEEARRCQRTWIRMMNRTLGNKNRRHFAIKVDFLTRQLAHSGMLIISGSIVPPHDWTSMEKELQLAGTGRLVSPDAPPDSPGSGVGCSKSRERAASEPHPDF